MRDRRVDIRAAIDGLLLAVPLILLLFVIPEPLFRIALDWTEAHPEAVDVGSLMWGCLLLMMPVMWVATRSMFPPFRGDNAEAAVDPVGDAPGDRSHGDRHDL